MLRAPRIPEIIFFSVLLWFASGEQGWTVLLGDGDTGWHIRNGERILSTGAVPRADPFAFGTEHRPWFAWEWLSDVLFAGLFRWGGLKAVSAFCGLLIAGYLSLLFRHLIWRQAGVLVALLLTLLSAGASSVHYLARPHVLGLFFFVAAWLLVVFLLWANCHGSFLAGLAILFLYLLDAAILRERRQVIRRGMLLLSCAAATLLNPYGWHLHAHAIEYLQSDWIRNTIEEFQSPRFRSEGMLQYELLLVAGVASLPWLVRRREWYGCGLVLLWAHESLSSVRHVPLYCASAAPLIAGWLQAGWDSVAASPRWRTLGDLNREWRGWCGSWTVWPAALAIGVLLLGKGSTMPRTAGFPDSKFPVELVDRNLERICGKGAVPTRVFSSDQWSDYLIFRGYPRVRVFFDGRSDFFASWRGDAYQQLMAGAGDSPAILDREGVDLALLPKNWALGSLLRTSGRWRVLDADTRGVLFGRVPEKDSDGPNQKRCSLR